MSGWKEEWSEEIFEPGVGRSVEVWRKKRKAKTIKKSNKLYI